MTGFTHKPHNSPLAAANFSHVLRLRQRLHSSLHAWWFRCSTKSIIQFIREMIVLSKEIQVQCSFPSVPQYASIGLIIFWCKFCKTRSKSYKDCKNYLHNR